jgi:photosystem II stability/assembly factor-like uncharacterized protein
MKKLCILLLAFISINSANAQWTPQTSGISGNTIYSVFFVDSNLGFAVGDLSLILKTTNGGTSWMKQNSGSTTEFFPSVFFADANIGYIANADKSILKTTDGGTTWVKKPIDIMSHSRSLYFINADTGWVVGGCGEIFKTTNGGDIWIKQLNCGIYVMHCFFVDANIGYVVGDYGNIIKTTDGGTNWVSLAGNSTPLHSIYFLDANTGYAVGDMGKILKTTDGGINWETKIVTSQTLYSVAFSDVNNGITVGSNGAIFKTSNGGTSWIPQNSGTTNGLMSISSVDTKTTYVVGENGLILKTTCGGGITTTVNSATICKGTSITLTASGADKYVWSIGDTTSSITVNPTDTSEYIVTGSTSGCSDSALAKVNVYDFKVTALNKTLTCGGSVFLNAYSNYFGAGSTEYAWHPSYGLNDSTIYNPIANPKSNTAYTITISTSDGCVASNTVTVDVVPFLLMVTDKDIVCGGSASLSTVTNYAGSGILSYSWRPGSGLTDSLIASPDAYPNHTIAYRVSAVSTDGCSATKNVSVNVLPLAVVGTSVNISCGDSTALQANSNYTGSSPLTYLWQTDTNSNYSTTANPIVQPNQSTVYRGTISTRNGCSATNDFLVQVNGISVSPEICIVTVDSSNKNVVVWDKPSTSAIDSVYIYRESEVTNVYTKIGAVTASEYGAFVDTNSFPDIQSNKYEISVFDKCNFETQKSLPHKTMHLAINKGAGNGWNLIWEGYEGFQVSTYLIYRGSNRENLTLIGTLPASNTQYSDFNAPDGNVYYQIEIISPNTCNPYKSINSIRSNIATNAPNNVYFKIYPNPALDYLIIETNKLAGDCSLSILNMNGQELIKQAAKENKIEVDINNLSAGVYFVKLICDNSVEVKKFIKK